jgi:hypothetical protein
MSTQHEFYLARAAEARADADTAKLENVRQRALRSEAAWLTMAARAERSDRLRTEADAKKEAARAAERGEIICQAAH